MITTETKAQVRNRHKFHDITDTNPFVYSFDDDILTKGPMENHAPFQRKFISVHIREIQFHFNCFYHIGSEPCDPAILALIGNSISVIYLNGFMYIDDIEKPPKYRHASMVGLKKTFKLSHPKTDNIVTLGVYKYLGYSVNYPRIDQ